jgi:hypothetical protein
MILNNKMCKSERGMAVIKHKIRGETEKNGLSINSVEVI